MELNELVHAKRLVLRAELMGFGADIATINIGSYASELDLMRNATDLVCPKCKGKAEYHPSHYECCGVKITSWQSLLRVKKGTKEPIEMPKLTKGSGEIERAKLSIMPFDEFKKYVDTTDPREPERFVTATDETSAKNLFKLLVAQEMDKTAILLTFNDTTEQKIALLTTTISGRIIVRFIVPKNLLKTPKESTILDRKALTQKDVEEARLFLKQIPKATEETLTVTDFRADLLPFAIGKTPKGEKPVEKVEALAVIMAQAKKKKEKK